MPRTIVITGAAGGIGRALCRLLRDDNLHLIDRPESGVAEFAESIGASFHAGSPLSVAECAEALVHDEIHGFGRQFFGKVLLRF